MKNLLLPLLLFLLLCHPVAAQQYHAKKYTLREGLPSNSVRDIFRDSRGILWIGTDAGLSTYDGKAISKVPLPENLSSKRVWAIAEDKAGKLWLGTYGGGLLRYDGHEFIKFTTPLLTSDLVRVLKYSQRYNGLLVGTQYGFSYITETEVFSWNPEEISNNRFLVMGFIDTHDGIIFHTFSHGAYHFNPLTREVNPLPAHSPLNVHSSSATFVSSIGDTLVGLAKNGLRIVSKDGVKDFHDLGQVFHISEDSHGILWISVWSYYDMPEPGGLYTFDGTTLRHVGSQWNVKDRLSWKTFPDPASGAIFAATDGEGMYKLINRGISHFPPSYFDMERLEIYDLATYKDNLWITTADAVIFGNIRKGFTVLNETYFMQQSFYPHHRLDSAVIFPPGRFLSLHIDTGHNLWVGSVNALFQLKNDTPEFHRFNFGKRFAENYFIFPDGSAFSGAWGHFRTAADIWSSDHYTYHGGSADLPTDINRFLPRHDKLWFSSFSYGLYRYKAGEFTRYGQQNPTLPQNLSALCIDDSGYLVAGTHNGKILILEGSDSLEVKFHLDNTQGIVGNEILWLLCDSKNRLWAGTNLGLNIIDLNNLYLHGHATVQFINESEGYFDYLARRAIQDENGIIWVGGKDYLTRIEPEKLLHKPQNQEKVKLTNFLINFKEVDWKSITLSDVWRNVPVDRVKLSHRQNHLSFAFMADNLLNPEKVMYSYILEGFASEPSPWSNNNELTYTNLSPGRYTLRVYATNLHTGKDYEPLQLQFRIKPPWYKTWLFNIAIILLIISSIYLIQSQRIQQVKKLERIKLDNEKRINSIRIQAIQAQMNPHFVFNVLSSIQNFMLDNDMDSTLEYLNDFSSLIRKTMENISEETIHLSEEIAYLKRYIKLENLRMGNSMRYRIHIDDALQKKDLKIPPMVIQPIVENAIKHGLAPKTGHKVLFLSFLLQGQVLKIEVCDNGKGLHTADQDHYHHHKPTGIKNTSERIHYFALSHKPDAHAQFGIGLSNRKKNGTTNGVKVEISLPVID